MELLDRIEEKARALKPARAAAAVLTFPFLAIGFVVGLVFRGVWFLVAFAWAAVVVAFAKGRGK